MRAVWEKAGLRSIDTSVIRIPISYGDFNDFWQSYSVPDGPSGQAIRKMSPSKIEQLKRRLREQLPTGPDGRIYAIGGWGGSASSALNVVEVYIP